MSAPDDSVPAVLAALRDVLEASGVTYAFGGAIALAAWSEPRATADVDVVVWLELDEIDRVIELVREAGVTVDGGAARTSAETRGMFVCRRGATRVDVFLPSIPFYREAALRRVRTAIAGAPAWVHSAEVLAVFKMLFFRGKDLVDLERMLAVQGTALDRAFVRDALRDMLGDDERITAWDTMCARVPVA